MDDEENEKKVWKARQDVEIASDELRMLNGEEPIYEASQKEFTKAEPPFCSFCGKGANQVNHMVPGNDANICNECISVAKEIIERS